ncbi:fluoride efflux transporter FluC [Sinosporangium siamense]|uniref:Fluoride-specific ion channel FluC n=1 Tax=Sinosporangium siamense TaxID=1367973 RepID=A0A919RJ21_9ACTN|nr:CrcB family protein [Sinosporangium siamense]GII94723.1 putative fluoride ion transporter CrcB 2 [Sinosporangium siamense]
MTLLLIALGAAVGAPLRYLIDRAIASPHPWGTFTANMAGSAVLGFLAAFPASPGVMALAGSGFCGALTTYSTFGFETLRLVENGMTRAALLNACGSVAAGLVAAYGGALAAYGVAR